MIQLPPKLEGFLWGLATPLAVAAIIAGAKALWHRCQKPKLSLEPVGKFLFTANYRRESGKVEELIVHLRFMTHNARSTVNVIERLAVTNPKLGNAKIERHPSAPFVPLTIHRDNPQLLEFFVEYRPRCEPSDVARSYELSVTATDKFGLAHTTRLSVPVNLPSGAA